MWDRTVARKGTGKTFFAFVNPAGAFHLNVRLCQQKLYKTTFDSTFGTACLGARFLACRRQPRRLPALLPARHQRPERKGPGALQLRENGHGGPGARQWLRTPGPAGPTSWETPPPHGTPPPAASLRAGEGEGEEPGRGRGRGEGCLPGNLERGRRAARSGACWELASPELCCTTSPRAARAAFPPRRRGAAAPS